VGISIDVDPANPGQFFACCGLMELADRLWPGAEGWFERGAGPFRIRPIRDVPDSSTQTLLNEITRCSLSNTMTSSQLQRRDELGTMTKTVREAHPSLEAEKKVLDAMWREAPIVLGEPFSVRIDWFVDGPGDGKTFKTWAGQQSVVDIAHGLKDLIEVHSTSPEKCLWQLGSSDCVPFYFDSDIGSTSSDLDVGFAVDPLRNTGLSVRVRPLLELGAFVGLQRFRPMRVGAKNEYLFSTWSEPLLPEIAAPVVSGCIGSLRARSFSFALLYRTKYLKSFLPATPMTRSL